MRGKISVIAGRMQSAIDFVRSDLQEDPARLRYIDREDRLYGLPSQLIYVLGDAAENREYSRIMLVARDRGMIFAHIDDSYARLRYQRGRQ